jgi:tetratricopeptide (TPR) repeat protein
MNKIRFLYSIVLLSFLGFAQQKSADSLMQVLGKTKNDIDKTNLLNAISDSYKVVDPKKMFVFGNQALDLAKKINYTIAQGNAYLNLGNSKIIEGDYKSATNYFQQAQEIFENESSTPNTKDQIASGLAKSYGSIGIVLSEQSNYAKALQFYLKSVKIYEKLDDQVRCAKLYNNIGVIYKSQKSDFKALEFFVKAEKIQSKLKDENISITLTNIANCYLNQNNLEKANFYYNEAKKVLDKHPNPRALGEWYNNKGLLKQAEKNTIETIENWQNAITTFQSIDDKFGLADTFLYLGQLYFEQQSLDKALESTNQALQIAKQIEVVEQQMLCEKLISEIYNKKGNASQALLHFQNYSALKDKLINEENIRKSVESSMNYEFEKKELLQKEAQEKREFLIQEEAKSFKLKMLFGTLIGLLVLGIIFLIYNRNQLKKTLTLQKELAEYEQKALHLQMNPHFVFNCLGSISSFIVQNGTDSAIKYLAKFSKLMRLTLEYSKESLIPIDKEIESLQNYLELEQLRFNNNFDFSITKSTEIEDDVALPPLLLQPFVENAIIHGVIPKKTKGKIKVDFQIDKESLVCTIEDDGVGCETSKKVKENSVSVHKSMAIDIIKKRLEMIASSTHKNATISIEEINANNNNSGTKVVLKLPIQYIQ